MKKYILSVLLMSAATLAQESKQNFELRYSPSCILEAVIGKMRKNVNPNIPLPNIYPSSTTSFEDFLKVAKTIYPDGTNIVTFFNFYHENTNSIFIVNSSDGIGMNGRTTDDVLAHELTHYVQHRYEKISEEEARSDVAEEAAIFVQFWFRDTYLRPTNASTPCPQAQSQGKELATGWSW